MGTRAAKEPQRCLKGQESNRNLGPGGWDVGWIQFFPRYYKRTEQRQIECWRVVDRAIELCGQAGGVP
jgi:hypothetical protein